MKDLLRRLLDSSRTSRPHVFAQMLDEAKVEPRSAVASTSVVTERPAHRRHSRRRPGDEFTGKVFIDATYEGDLMAMAGVKYHVGREGRDYNESLAGVARSPAHQWPVKVNALVPAYRPLSLAVRSSQPAPAIVKSRLTTFGFA